MLLKAIVTRESIRVGSATSQSFQFDNNLIELDLKARLISITPKRGIFPTTICPMENVAYFIELDLTKKE